MDFGGGRENFPRRRNVEELPAPAAHAFLRPQRVIVRHHIVDGENALQPDLGRLDDAAGLLDLVKRRHQRRAVFQRPAVILHIGDFQPVGIQIDRHLDDLGQLEQVLPMHDRIDRQRKIELAGPFCHLDLPGMGAPKAGNTIRRHGLVALETDLDVA